MPLSNKMVLSYKKDLQILINKLVCLTTTNVTNKQVYILLSNPQVLD
jgi:hypothetical protein